MSDTPLTDDRVVYAEEIGVTSNYSEWINAPFVRGLERELNAANARIKRLEEAGELLYETVSCGCGIDGPCKWCTAAQEKWDELKEVK